jgi:hypothetical protein
VPTACFELAETAGTAAPRSKRSINVNETLTIFRFSSQEEFTSPSRTDALEKIDVIYGLRVTHMLEAQIDGFGLTK